MNSPFKLSPDPVYTCSYCDFQEYVKEVYGRDFCFCSDQESSNDSTHEFHVIRDPLDDYAAMCIAEFLEKGTQDWLASTLLQDMCNKKLINPGRYLIHVCW